jgi:hypothetical protein
MEGKIMKVKGIIAASVMAFGACVLPFAAARADVVLYDQANFVSGEEAFTQTLDVTTPGTLTLTLSGVPWLDTISGMNGFLTTASGMVTADSPGGGMVSGSESFNVGAGTFYAHWFGDAQGPNDLGVLCAKIVFTANPSAVALPASWLLLLSGLVVMARLKRRPVDHKPLDRKPMEGLPA